MVWDLGRTCGTDEAGRETISGHKRLSGIVCGAGRVFTIFVHLGIRPGAASNSLSVRKWPTRSAISNHKSTGKHYVMSAVYSDTPCVDTGYNLAAIHEQAGFFFSHKG